MIFHVARLTQIVPAAANIYKMAAANANGVAYVNGDGVSPGFPAQDIGEFIRSLRGLAEHPGLQSLSNLARDWTCLEGANRFNCSYITRLMAENDSLKQTVSEKNDELKNANGRIKQLEDELAAQKEAAASREKQFKAQSGRLALLESFALKPTAMEETEMRVPYLFFSALFREVFVV